MEAKEITEFTRVVHQLTDELHTARDSNKLLKQELNFATLKNTKWEELYKQQQETIEAQAQEIRALQANYSREMQSQDKLMEEADERLKNCFTLIDNLKQQLLDEKIEKINLSREVGYLQQFQPQPDNNE